MAELCCTEARVLRMLAQPQAKHPAVMFCSRPSRLLLWCRSDRAKFHISHKSLRLVYETGCHGQLFVRVIGARAYDRRDA